MHIAQPLVTCSCNVKLKVTFGTSAGSSKRITYYLCGSFEEKSRENATKIHFLQSRRPFFSEVVIEHCVKIHSLNTYDMKAFRLLASVTEPSLGFQIWGAQGDDNKGTVVTQSRKNRGCLSLISNMENQFSAVSAVLKKLPKKVQL